MSSTTVKWALIATAASTLCVVALVSLVATFQSDDGPKVQRKAPRGGVSATTAFRPVAFEADRFFPMETLGDVALRADAIVLGTPVAELELEDPEIIARGEGYLGRRITVQVDRILWQKPGSAVPSDTVETGGGSWRYSNGARSRFVFFGELGKQYLFVFAHNTNPADTDGYQWNHEITLGLPMIDGQTPAVIESDKPFFDALQGRTPEALERLFASSLRS